MSTYNNIVYVIGPDLSRLVGWPALIAFTFVSTLVLVFGEGPPPHDPRDDFRD